MQVYIDAAFLPVKEYARRTNQTPAAVSQQVRAGKLPIRPRQSEQEQILINNALLIKQALEQQF